MHSITAVSRNKGVRAAIFLAGGYALSRILFLCFLHPFYSLTSPLEEPYRGAMGMEFMRGLAMPLWNYAADTYSGGFIFIGGLASGVFRLFGPSLFSLKLVSISLFSLGLFFWVLLLEEQMGRRTALWFAFLYILSPPALTRYMLVTLGDHTETLVFQGMGLYFFLQALKKPCRGKWLWGFLCGFVSGLGIWMAYIHLLFVLGIGLYALFFERRLGRAGWCAILLGLAAGIFPCLAFNLSGGFQSFQVLGAPAWQHFHWKFFMESLLQWKRWFPVHVLISFTMNDAMPSWISAPWPNLFYGAALGLPVGIWFIMSGSQKKSVKPNATMFQNPITRLGMIYLALMALGHHVSDFKALRYVLPVNAILFYASARALALSEDYFPVAARVITPVFAGIWILLTGLFHGPLCSRAYAGEAMRIPGYNYTWLSQSPVCRDPGKCFQVYETLKKHLAPRQVQELRLSIPYSILDRYGSAAELFQAVQNLTPSLDSGIEKYFYFFLGCRLLEVEGQDLSKSLAALELFKLSPARRVWTLLGVAQGISETKIPMTASWLKQAKFFPSPINKIFLRHSGKRWLLAYVDGGGTIQDLGTRLSAFLPQVEADAASYFIQGVGMGLALEWNNDPLRALWGLENIERQHLPDPERLLQGIGMSFEETRFFDLGVMQPWRDQKVIKKMEFEEKKMFHQGEDQFRQEYASLGFEEPDRVAPALPVT
ncbi:MAG: hypothetical protein EXS63_07855 [Candidatus Omnitrophica bacterium]|nr:hypothetical protein [Candidatus Omnitrophota bacterium]